MESAEGYQRKILRLQQFFNFIKGDDVFAESTADRVGLPPERLLVLAHVSKRVSRETATQYITPQTIESQGKSVRNGSANCKLCLPLSSRGERFEPIGPRAEKRAKNTFHVFILAAREGKECLYHCGLLSGHWPKIYRLSLAWAGNPKLNSFGGRLFLRFLPPDSGNLEALFQLLRYKRV